MFKLRDFFHLPQVDQLLERMIADGPGLRVVAGLDPRLTPNISASSGFLPSGRGILFGIMINETLAAHSSANCMVITTDKEALRLPREIWRRCEIAQIRSPYTYAGRIQEAIHKRPDLLVIDQLSAENAALALKAAQQGLRVITQIDTVFRGAEVAHSLLDLEATKDELSGLTWVFTVQRVAALCSYCKQPDLPDPHQLTRLREYYSNLARLHNDELSYRWAKLAIPGQQVQEERSEPGAEQPAQALADLSKKFSQEPAQGELGTFYRVSGCSKCHNTGRQGDIAIFDILRTDASAPDFLEQPSQLAMKTYVLHLASLGRLPLEDFFHFEADRFRHTYKLFVASERALVETNHIVRSKLIQLEAANRVLQQRTDALISLHDIGQALTTTHDLDDLAHRVCRRACDMCGADRAILYYLGAPGQVEVLAVGGWDPGLIHKQLDASLVIRADLTSGPVFSNAWPPGVPLPTSGPEKITLRAGLYVPLLAQEQQVGVMIIHSSQKPSFTQGEAAMLQTFANQAAVAIQRAGLVEQLRTKVDQLEAAQAELAKKERMDREMELAHEVQQSMLPRTFPQITGYHFAARNLPARQVGGDFYDVIFLDEDHFGIAIADVSDKGMPAALYMALTRSLLLAEARRERSPRAVVSNINRILLELGEPNMFVTLFYGLVERSKKRLTYTRAGHDRPILLRHGDIIELGGVGAALGILDPGDLNLSEEQVDLAVGDRLFLYTDGLTDILSSSGQLFDRDRLKILLQSVAGLPAGQQCDSIFASLSAYRGDSEPYDDMTLLLIGVNEPG